MKLSTKIILPIILISALLILLTGCFGVPADESPGYTPSSITGIIAAPCCENSVESADGETDSPEFWCYYCLDEELWKLQNGVEVILTYGEDEIDTTTTNQYGEFTFTDVDPGKNYVITAYCPDYTDDRPLVKDVALEIIEGGSFDTKITDLVSTSLGLVVDFLVEYSELGPEDIELDEVIEDKPDFPKFPKFKKLIRELSRVLEENCGNVNIDGYLQDALCLASQEIGRLVIPDLDLGCIAGATPPVSYTLTAKAAPPAGGSVTGGGTYSSGTTANIIATANTGYQFVDWTGDTVANANLATTTILMNGNKSIIANFEESADVTIYYEATTGGSVSLASETLAPATGVAAGSTAAADPGYQFVNWTKSSVEVGTALHFTPAKVGGLNVAATYTANFEESADVTIYYEATTGGSVSLASETLAPATGVAAGSTAEADFGYHFVNWTNESDVEVGTSLHFTPAKVGGLNVAATYTANFEEDTDVTITYVATTGGSVDPTSETLAPVTGVAAGSTAAADPDYSFVNWTNESDVEVGTSLHFTPAKVGGLNVAATYTANFELNPCCDLDAKLTVNSIEWYKDPSDSIWKVKTDCKVVDNTCGYWLTVEAELFDDSSVFVVADASVSHGQKFTAKSTLSSGVGGDTAPTGYSVRISFYDRDELCVPYVQEGFDIPYPSI